MADEDWRVEVELNDEAHGFSLGERLRALDLDDEARKRLGSHVTVTRDGSRLFLYAATEEQANEAARVVRELVDADELSAELRTTRWHPAEEDWLDASAPLPTTQTEVAAERRELEERKRSEVEAGHGYDWHVHIRAPDRAAATKLEQRLGERELPVERRWRFLTVDVLTEEAGDELAAELRAELPAADVHVEPTMDAPSPFLVMVRSWL